MTGKKSECVCVGGGGHPDTLEVLIGSICTISYILNITSVKILAFEGNYPSDHSYHRNVTPSEGVDSCKQSANISNNNTAPRDRFPERILISGNY